MSGPRLTLDIRTLHPDEHVIPLVKTAVLSMLYESLSLNRGRKVREEVRAAYDDAGGDEPTDTRAAGRIIASMEEPVVLEGDVARRSKKALVFRDGGAIRVTIELRDESLGRHLSAGATWTAAPLFE